MGATSCSWSGNTSVEPRTNFAKTNRTDSVRRGTIRAAAQTEVWRHRLQSCDSGYERKLTTEAHRINIDEEKFWTTKSTKNTKEGIRWFLEVRDWPCNQYSSCSCPLCPLWLPSFKTYTAFSLAAFFWCLASLGLLEFPNSTHKLAENPILLCDPWSGTNADNHTRLRRRPRRTPCACF